MKINILGGGPAGLYFAILMKKADPSHDVTIIERDGPDDTFGWGIVFSGRTLAGLADYDEPSHDAIADAFQLWDNVDVVHQGEKISIRGNSFAGIGRLAFLNILHDRCRELGVMIRFHTNVTEADHSSYLEADLVLAADGANSLTRHLYAEQFQPEIEMGRNKYIWLGTHRLFHGLTFTFRQHESGAYAAHSYKFNGSTSTFIAELSEETWRRAGYEGMSEEETLKYLQGVFADDLDGYPLMTNGFLKWLNFPIIRNRCWHHGNMVLAGDALRTAHFSIGSGTKLALEDSIALFESFQAKGTGDVSAVLRHYQESRKPEVDAYQQAAHSSLVWFETIEERMNLAPVAMAWEVMTRSGRVDADSLRKRDARFVERYETWKAGQG
jgi:anthraniloyl-CoA monooxygenase